MTDRENSSAKESKLTSSDPRIVVESEVDKTTCDSLRNVVFDLTRPEKLVGETIAGKYLIESYLGGGGMSQVYKARHLHLKSKVVALKLLSAQSGLDPQRIMRLQQEANAVSYLSHPNIVGVQDFGVAEGGQPYMVMDYFDGVPLDEIIQKTGALEIDRLLNLMNQTCSALSHAHEKGVIHRDIKPSNIMVGVDEQGNELVKVVDFGIAKLTSDGNEPDMAKLTQTGDVVGSPLYMSPEQCLGQDVDGRSDIYSLGCVMYECITGNSPFRGATVLETLHKQMNLSPPPFSLSGKSDSRRRALEATVLKMLAKSPNQRYRFMLEVASELHKLRYSAGSAAGRLKVMWELWRARRGARSQKSAVLDASLGVSSILAVICALMIFSVPFQVERLAPEEARHSLIMAELNRSVGSLKHDSANIQELFFSKRSRRIEDNVVIIRSFREMQILCRDHPEELQQLQDLDDAVNKASLSAFKLKRVIVKKLRNNLFGAFDEDNEDNDALLGKALAAWAEPISQANLLYARAATAAGEVHKEIEAYQKIFAACKMIGIGLLVALAVMIVMKLIQLKAAAKGGFASK